MTIREIRIGDQLTVFGTVVTITRLSPVKFSPRPEAKDWLVAEFKPGLGRKGGVNGLTITDRNCICVGCSFLWDECRCLNQSESHKENE
jgi:hypothetical protein